MNALNGRVLRRSLLLTFALPAVMQGFMNAPAQSLLQGIYAKHAGLALVALGGAVLFVRLFDAFTDPLIGLVSDWTYRRSGTRKPWLVGGTLVTVTAMWFLFQPPADVSIGYFTFWFVMANVGWSLTEIPYRAWSLELTSEYVQRSRVQTWIAIFMLLGTTSFYLFPYLAKTLGRTDATDFNFEVLAVAAVFVVVALPILNALALWRVPDGAVQPATRRDSWREIWISIAGNGPLLQFTAAFIVVSLAGGMAQGVTYLYLDVYLGLAQQLAGIMVLTVPVMLLAVPFWGWLCTRYERHHVWSVSIAMLAGVYVLYGFVPAQQGAAVALPVTLLFALASFCVTATIVVAPAIVGDIVDHGKLKFGHDRAGTYFAFYSLILKSLQGLGIGLGLAIIGWAGFDATAKAHAPHAAFVLRGVAAWIPAIGLICTVPFLWNFPINRARQRAIVAELRSREAGAA